MITQAACALLTAIQNRASAALNDIRRPTKQESDSLLLKLLRSDAEMPDIEILDFPGLLDRLTLGDLLDAISAGPKTRSRSGVRDLLGIDLNRLDLGNLSDFGRRLVDGDPIAVVGDAIDELRENLGDQALSDTIHGIVRRQVGIGISFVTTLSNLVSPELPERILEGWKQYFFGDAGYATVDGISIVAPGHAGLLARLEPLELSAKGFQQSLNGLRGLLSERSAEQYVRDLIRIVVEVGGDQKYRLSARLDEADDARARPEGEGEALVQGRGVDGGVAGDQRRRGSGAGRGAVPDEPRAGGRRRDIRRHRGPQGDSACLPGRGDGRRLRPAKSTG